MDVLELRGSRERTLGGYEVPETIVWADGGTQLCKVLTNDNHGFAEACGLSSTTRVERKREVERDFVRQVGVSVLKAGMGEVDTVNVWDTNSIWG
jgi:hypothetical protein